MINAKKCKAKEIVFGVLSVLLLFSIGQLMAGRITLGEEIEFHNVTYLSFAFPFIAAAALIWFAAYSAKNNKTTYYKTVIICFLIPFAARLIAGLFSAFDSSSTVAIMFYMFSVPISSVTISMFYSLDETNLSEVAETIVIIAVNLIPMIFGLVASLIFYRKNTVSTDG